MLERIAWMITLKLDDTRLSEDNPLISTKKSKSKIEIAVQESRDITNGAEGMNCGSSKLGPAENLGRNQWPF